jgi:hypothetical protein
VHTWLNTRTGSPKPHPVRLGPPDLDRHHISLPTSTCGVAREFCRACRVAAALAGWLAGNAWPLGRFGRGVRRESRPAGRPDQRPSRSAGLAERPSAMAVGGVIGGTAPRRPRRRLILGERERESREGESRERRGVLAGAGTHVGRSTCMDACASSHQTAKALTLRGEPTAEYIGSVRSLVSTWHQLHRRLASLVRRHIRHARCCIQPAGGARPGPSPALALALAP